MSLLPESANKTGQQCEAQAWDLWVNLAGKVPTKVRELDLLGLVESRKQAFHSAQRTQTGGFSGRPNSSLFEGQGQRTWVLGVPGPESTVAFGQRAILPIALSACSEV